MLLQKDRIVTVLTVIAVLSTVFVLAGPGKAEKLVAGMTEDQRISYTLGFVTMHRIANAGYIADVDAFTAGMRAVTADEPPALTPEEMQVIMKRVLAAAKVRASRLAAADAQSETDEVPVPQESDMHSRPDAPTPSYGQMSVQLNTQIPSGRIDTASEQTRINHILSENPNLDPRDLEQLK